MSNMEMTPIRKDELDRHPSQHAISNASSSPPPGTKDINSDEDVEQTPTSSVPLLSPIAGCRGDRRPLLISIFWKWASMFFVPVVCIAYLTFCYVVHYRVVPAKVPGLSANTSTQFLTNLGAGITTINIIIISLALFPLKGLLYDLQSEEFFRLLSAQKNSRGVELTAVNGISNSSYSLIELIMVVVHRNCSLYYVMAFIAAVIVWAVSTLAPAALSIQPILIDGPIMAFSVGAIPPLTLYQPVASGQTLLATSFSPAAGYSAAIVWAEREIGLSYSFSVANDSQGLYSGLVVPAPPILNSTVNARWLTDVIGFNPYCTWPNPVNLTATSLNFTMNSTDVPNSAVTVHLQGLDLQVSVPSAYFPVYDSYFVTSVNAHDPTTTILNYTTGSLPTDGAMVMSVIKCASTSCTEKAIDITALFVDFTNIPSMGFSSIGADYEIAFLVCKPNITIETREIRTLGSMTLEVQPLAVNASPYPRQGNLDWTQTSLLVAYSLSKLSTDSGPSSSEWFGLGSGTQADFIFGSDKMNSIPTGVNYENTTMVLEPLPPNQLTQGYTEMVKAAMKPYVSGSLGTTYVPGRIATVQQIFLSSLPHVIASTVLISVLFMMAVAAHFRPGKGDQFNLTNVAAALADSKFPEEAKRTKVSVIAERLQKRSRGRWLGDSVGQEVARRLGNWKVFLKRPDGLEVLHVAQEESRHHAQKYM